jgi:hypothetical protein
MPRNFAAIFEQGLNGLWRCFENQIENIDCQKFASIKKMEKETVLKNFGRLFKQIFMEDNFRQCIYIGGGEDVYAVTAGAKRQYNSMIGSGGGMKLLFKNQQPGVLFNSGVIRLS